MFEERAERDVRLEAKECKVERNYITLNLSIPALEKLFEGDPEAVISIRKAAILEFSRRKIGELLDKAAKADIEAAVREAVGYVDKTGWQQKILLQEPILKAIQAETKKATDAYKALVWSMITESVNAAVKSHIDEIAALVDNTVKRQIEAETADRINKAVRSRIDKMLEAVAERDVR